MAEPILSELNIYPVKSMSGISINSAKVEQRGLKFDRRWMLVDKENEFMSQREFPEMSLLKVDIANEGINVSHKKRHVENLFVPVDIYEPGEIEVSIWDDKCKAVLVSNAADCWFSKVLNKDCKLVYMPDDSLRQVDTRYASTGKIVGFADAYPFLLIGRASLDELNKRLKSPVPMNRFRPNLVVDNAEPFEEDSWKKFKIGNIIFECVKPCARCVVTTIDQQTAEKDKEPLATLSTFREENGKVLFGQNLIQEGEGIINVGDKIEVLEWK